MTAFNQMSNLTVSGGTASSAEQWKRLAENLKSAVARLKT